VFIDYFSEHVGMQQGNRLTLHLPDFRILFPSRECFDQSRDSNIVRFLRNLCVLCNVTFVCSHANSSTCKSKFAKIPRMISFCISRAKAFIFRRDFHPRSNLSPMESVLGMHCLIAWHFLPRAENAGPKRKRERETEPSKNASRFTTRCNSGWRVYNGETSRIIKRNADVRVTRLDGGKLDLRG